MRKTAVRGSVDRDRAWILPLLLDDLVERVLHAAQPARSFLSRLCRLVMVYGVDRYWYLKLLPDLGCLGLPWVSSQARYYY